MRIVKEVIQKANIIAIINILCQLYKFVGKRTFVKSKQLENYVPH